MWRGYITFFVTLTLIFLQFESLQDLFTIDFFTTRAAGHCGPVVLCVMLMTKMSVV